MPGNDSAYEARQIGHERGPAVTEKLLAPPSARGAADRFVALSVVWNESNECYSFVC
jgi:hypothetical protein